HVQLGKAEQVRLLESLNGGSREYACNRSVRRARRHRPHDLVRCRSAYLASRAVPLSPICFAEACEHADDRNGLELRLRRLLVRLCLREPLGELGTANETCQKACCESNALNSTAHSFDGHCHSPLDACLQATRPVAPTPIC